jgi:hypothetical protein
MPGKVVVVMRVDIDDGYETVGYALRRKERRGQQRQARLKGCLLTADHGVTSSLHESSSFPNFALVLVVDHGVRITIQTTRPLHRDAFMQFHFSYGKFPLQPMLSSHYCASWC